MVAAYLDFGKLMALIDYLTKLHQIWLKCHEFGSEHIYDIENTQMIRIQDGGCRRLEYRQVAVP